MIVIADAGPLLHLFWVDALSWALPTQEIVVVETVWREVDQYAPEALQDSRLQRTPAVAAVPPRLLSRGLDPGEEAALAYALAQANISDLLVLCDDQQARKACQEFAVPVTGTVGLIVAAFQTGRASQEEAITALQDLPGRGRFYVKPTLIARAIATIQERKTDEKA